VPILQFRFFSRDETTSHSLLLFEKPMESLLGQKVGQWSLPLSREVVAFPDSKASFFRGSIGDG
jgi:hypothetical protein